MRPRPHGCMTGPAKTVVCPTNCNEVHTFSQSDVNYIHPSHTNVVNHHTIKNTHFYPHSTSYQNTVNSTNVYGGSFEVPNQRPPFFR
ncbi:hypothetical protein Pryu01_00358 [Paraliobacillus ryukyuensis]|uniref:Spore coat protein D n=1 Tax=Paraliobacillus ryukyuensis TaxID=200904 RepID=A0A366EIL6_9BACI|nr:CotD family spore coat protein [Paraliobacillus ryukyuensis]RBP01570.1 spore coat protein D [Paraliobacillus ryukyuensis]